jgi:hypothetical protein
MDYLDKNNRNPKKYVWTKDAGEIIDKVNICKDVLGTGH